MVASLVTLFKKLKFVTDENVGWGPIDLPELELQTTAYWLTAEAAAAAGGATSSTSRCSAPGGRIQTVAAVLLMVDPRDLGLVDPGPLAPRRGTRRSTCTRRCPGGIGLSRAALGAPRRAADRRRPPADRGCGCDGGCPACTGPAARARRRRPRRSRCGCSPSSTGRLRDLGRRRSDPASASGADLERRLADVPGRRDAPAARAAAPRIRRSRSRDPLRRRRPDRELGATASRPPSTARSSTTAAAASSAVERPPIALPIDRDRLRDLPGPATAPTLPLVCLDTETTGLATAAGTVAFLVGLGWWEGDRFRQVQLLLPDHAGRAGAARRARRATSRPTPGS